MEEIMFVLNLEPEGEWFLPVKSSPTTGRAEVKLCKGGKQLYCSFRTTGVKINWLDSSSQATIMKLVETSAKVKFCTPLLMRSSDLETHCEFPLHKLSECLTER